MIIIRNKMGLHNIAAQKTRRFDQTLLPQCLHHATALFRFACGFEVLTFLSLFSHFNLFLLVTSFTNLPTSEKFGGSITNLSNVKLWSELKPNYNIDKTVWVTLAGEDHVLRMKVGEKKKKKFFQQGHWRFFLNSIAESLIKKFVEN